MLNLFLQGHRAKIQAEFASTITDANLATTPALHQVIVQTQLAFRPENRVLRRGHWFESRPLLNLGAKPKVHRGSESA